MVAAWNGLAISALAECGLLFGQPAPHRDRPRRRHACWPRCTSRARKLIRTSRDGYAGDTEGVLEDYACVAEGFLVLSGVTGEARWLTLAGELLETALEAFGDGAGGFYDTAADGESLIFRPADAADNATPSGTFAMAGALLSYAALTGSARHREAAEAALGVLPAIAARYPRAAGAGLAVAEAWLAGPAEIAIVGHEDDERTRASCTRPRCTPPRPARSWPSATGPTRRCRCWSAAGWSTAPRPRTSAASSPAWRRSPRPQELRAALAAPSYVTRGPAGRGLGSGRTAAASPGLDRPWRLVRGSTTRYSRPPALGMQTVKDAW